MATLQQSQSPQHPPSASRYRAISALLALQAAREVMKVWGNPLQAATTLVRHQIMAAQVAEKAVGTMLTDQGIPDQPQARLYAPAWTTPPQRFEAMAAATEEADAYKQRLIESIMQETSRAAQQTAIAVQEEELGYVRHLTLPSCSRCAILAGRIYPYSQGFQRHPGCDCTMVPVQRHAKRVTYDAEALASDGQVTGLSKADRKAIAEGADPAQVVNIRSKAAGLATSGQVLSRGVDALTPAGIYQQAGDDRSQALDLLRKYGYIR